MLGEASGLQHGSWAMSTHGQENKGWEGYSEDQCCWSKA